MSPRHPAGPRTESTEPAVDAETLAGDTAATPGGEPAERGAATPDPAIEDPGTEDTGETTEDPGPEDTGETTEDPGPEDTGETTEDGSPDAAPEPDVAQLAVALAERTADLQRLQAEYVNYKRRVDRDRELVRENATYAALAPIVDVLDTIDRAREHGELDAGFAAVADQLERVVSSAGLVKYGEPGDAFDPRLHEALSHIGEDPEVEVTTCKVIAKAGYRIGDRVVRAAQVLVVDPASG